MTKTLDEQIRCVQREIAKRERLYPQYVYVGGMTETHADHELKCMKAVLETLQALYREEENKKKLQEWIDGGIGHPQTVVDTYRGPAR